MKEKPWFAVAYIFCLTAILSFIVIGFAEITKERVKANQQLALEKAVLEAFGIAEGKSSAQLHETFLDRISPDESGEYYTLTENGKTAGYAIQVAGNGFWAPIKGIVAVSADRKNIIGISFHEQNETPGLGGEIVKPLFRDKFKGLKISPTENPIGFKPFGADLAENEIHAISGATQTCTRLEILINDDLAKWLKAVPQEDAN
jgi:Na+-transporting NADH:ubiquinone oxidoreductase subunit C